MPRFRGELLLELLGDFLHQLGFEFGENTIHDVGQAFVVGVGGSGRVLTCSRRSSFCMRWSSISSD